MCFCGSRKEDIMYQKNYVLLLVSMVICTIMLWFSRVYMVQGEEKDTEQTAAHCVDMQGYETSSECRNITLGVLEPAYVINVSAEDVEVLMRIVEAEARRRGPQREITCSQCGNQPGKRQSFPGYGHAGRISEKQQSSAVLTCI